MKFIKSILVIPFIVLLAFSGNLMASNNPPAVSITFFGPVLDGINTRFKCTIAIYELDVDRVAILLGENSNKQLLIHDLAPKFEKKDVKNRDGETITIMEWSGYTDLQEVTESEPVWLHNIGGRSVSVTATVIKDDNTVGVSEQRATISKAGAVQIINAALHNKKLTENTL